MSCNKLENTSKTRECQDAISTALYYSKQNRTNRISFFGRIRMIRFRNFENIRIMPDWHIILKINVPLCNSTTCHVISWKTLQKHGNVKMMSQLFQQLSHWHSKGDWGSPQTTIKWLFFFCFAQNWVINGVCCCCCSRHIWIFDWIYQN